MEFVYTTNIDTDEPVMWIDKHIGYDEDEGFGIMGDVFGKELHALDAMGKKKIRIKINSIGGVVLDGYNIFNAILATKAAVDTECIGIAASIAAVIFQAGRKRIMADYGVLMYHNPQNGSAKGLNAFRDSIITMISSKSGMDEIKVGAIMDRTTFLSADDALKMGLCDEVVSSVNLNTKYLKKEASPVNFYKECLKIVNKAGYESPIKTPDMENKALLLVTAKLGLTEAASGENILTEIGKIENRANEAEVAKVRAEKEASDAKAELARIQNKATSDLKEMENKLAKAKADYDTMEEAYNKMKQEKADAEDAAMTEKCTNMVNEFAKVGRIKNDATIINKWVKLAKDDFDGTKAMIEAIPLNKEGEKVDKITNKLGKGAQGYSAAVVMATINANKKK